jgi:hypothetical protein
VDPTGVYDGQPKVGSGLCAVGPLGSIAKSAAWSACPRGAIADTHVWGDPSTRLVVIAPPLEVRASSCTKSRGRLRGGFAGVPGYNGNTYTSVTMTPGAAASPPLSRGAAPRTDSGVPLVPVDRMPEPGEPCPGFIAEPGRCWRMVYSQQLQATHCREAPEWAGRWFSPKRRPMVSRVGLSRPPRGLTGLRQFGRRREP